MTQKAFADAKAIGIKREEIDEEVESLYRTLVDAVVHFDPKYCGMTDIRGQTCRRIPRGSRIWNMHNWTLAERYSTRSRYEGLSARRKPWH